MDGNSEAPGGQNGHPGVIPSPQSRELQDDRQLAMGVEPGGLGFMLDMFGHNTPPLQFLREFTQNSIQAVLATPERTGTVVWDVYEPWVEEYGVKKLCCIDTGVGMTGEEIHRYINHAFCSTHRQSHDANFGIGAKGAAFSRNPVGVLYLSWKEGRGYLAEVYRDPGGRYGLRQQELPDGRYAHWLEGVSENLKPPQIHDHGTCVVLYGEQWEQNTLAPPADARVPESAWITYALNTRYFEIPEGISVKARDYWATEDGAQRRHSVYGMKHYLDYYAENSGITYLDDALVHWWILEEDSSGRSGTLAPKSGHIAALYQGEVYEMKTLGQGTQRLQMFGVKYGYDRVVLYVEPHAGLGELLAPDLMRTRLKMGGHDLDWSHYGAQFRAEMPAEIRELQEKILARSLDRDHRGVIEKRIQELWRLYKPRAFRRAHGGQRRAGHPTHGGSPRDHDKEAGGIGKPGGKGGRGGRDYTAWLDKRIIAADEIMTYPRVEAQWVTEAEGTRIAPDLEDRAARYFPDENLLWINGDFRVFREIVDDLAEKYPGALGGRKAIEHLVEIEFEWSLVETVISFQALQGAKRWSTDELREALSEEALTAAVMPRYHIYNAVTKALRREGDLYPAA